GEPQEIGICGRRVGEADLGDEEVVTGWQVECGEEVHVELHFLARNRTVASGVDGDLVDVGDRGRSGEVWVEQARLEAQVADCGVEVVDLVVGGRVVPRGHLDGAVQVRV